MNKVGKPPREFNTFCVIKKADSMEKLRLEVSTFKHRPLSSATVYLARLFSCADPGGGGGAGGTGMGTPMKIKKI